MSPNLRNALRAACAAAAMVLTAPAGAQTEVRVMAHGGVLPFTSVHGGGQVQVTPGGGSTSLYAEYNQWAWGLICESVLDPGAPGGIGGDDDRCSETGYTVHAGFTRHLRGTKASWRPYLSAGAGVARVLDRYVPDRPVRASLAVEGGYDVGGAGAFTVRLGARWQGRPQVGTDYVGPVIGLALRL
jgi:hypothetical protein